MALRQALGARAGRLLRQVLTESVLLSFTGGILALLLSFWFKDWLLQFVPSNMPRLAEVSLSLRVLCFGLGISVITGLAFGLAPAWQPGWRNRRAGSSRPIGLAAWCRDFGNRCVWKEDNSSS